ncbi:MAG: ABC transporter ATP-binding protein [Candidatus Heimdallarchaeum endolithica]|uniref:ABC transporter ATP-binding protein n=1 Tax=Candidatus Heimdallarchaeum endolithica TaxID=2876572 RepID=A0A9Y1BSH1_9ARCH|nr:MAG: ABC transporter ATP-binding protein [Candidatus Heimdallarchaeum endolithica]
MVTDDNISYSDYSIDEKYTVKATNLVKRFGNLIAVNNLTFKVRKGEIFGLLGPNGAGKTTTVKMILGLLEPDEGEIKVFDLHPEKDEIEVKKRVGYVSEEPLIYRSMTARQLFNFVGSLRNLDPEETSQKLYSLLESFEALPYYDKLIATLSRGNKQKMQVIASLIHDPDLLIMDEPLTGLDAKSAKVLKEILEMHKEKGGSVILSTHILEIAEELCDRIAIIDHGRLIALGTVEELSHLANKVGADLEDIFLRLTNQDESVDKIVEKLRKSMKNGKIVKK